MSWFNSTALLAAARADMALGSLITCWIFRQQLADFLLDLARHGNSSRALRVASAIWGLGFGIAGFSVYRTVQLFLSFQNSTRVCPKFWDNLVPTLSYAVVCLSYLLLVTGKSGHDKRPWFGPLSCLAMAVVALLAYWISATYECPLTGGWHW